MNTKNFKEGFLLREVEIEDLNNFYNLIDSNREIIQRFLAGLVSKTTSLASTRVFIDDAKKRKVQRKYFIYVIVDKLSNEFIMFFDLKNIDWSIPKAEMGCFIDKEYKGKGLTTNYMNFFLDYCFNELELKKVFLRTHITNVPMRIIADKCGFQREGVIRSDYRTSFGELIDVFYYGLLKEDYVEFRQNLSPGTGQ
ncbi:GNAT family N-acetyltransferase [Abyssalbus ytuae]|uniref:GNAT family N-acetyltransferase n=1 Tax=Abyssalbus ytuae TaxID=2926907 RepID=A0A9E6ZVT4_9FLAO|nr:GNAT family protein [Abyssalbus ytuae]UOB16147.1 GNAT family N-acetyltransferase [Abyssalbus ytuae]